MKKIMLCFMFIYILSISALFAEKTEGEHIERLINPLSGQAELFEAIEFFQAQDSPTHEGVSAILVAAQRMNIYVAWERDVYERILNLMVTTKYLEQALVSEYLVRHLNSADLHRSSIVLVKLSKDVGFREDVLQRAEDIIRADDVAMKEFSDALVERPSYFSWAGIKALAYSVLESTELNIQDHERLKNHYERALRNVVQYLSNETIESQRVQFLLVKTMKSPYPSVRLASAAALLERRYEPSGLEAFSAMALDEALADPVFARRVYEACALQVSQKVINELASQLEKIRPNSEGEVLEFWRNSVLETMDRVLKDPNRTILSELALINRLMGNIHDLNPEILRQTLSLPFIESLAVVFDVATQFGGRDVNSAVLNIIDLYFLYDLVELKIEGDLASSPEVRSNKPSSLKVRFIWEERTPIKSKILEVLERLTHHSDETISTKARLMHWPLAAEFLTITEFSQYLALRESFLLWQTDLHNSQRSSPVNRPSFIDQEIPRVMEVTGNESTEIVVEEADIVSERIDTEDLELPRPPGSSEVDISDATKEARRLDLNKEPGDFAFDPVARSRARLQAKKRVGEEIESVRKK
ncbi:MAG: hypothetical protein ABIA04_08530 [Pseudomonadota bacterium]